MSVSLPPVDAKSRHRREMAARIQQDRAIVEVAPWPGERHMRRWTLLDELIYGDAIPVAFALFVFFLMVGR